MVVLLELSQPIKQATGDSEGNQPGSTGANKVQERQSTVGI